MPSLFKVKRRVLHCICLSRGEDSADESHLCNAAESKNRDGRDTQAGHEYIIACFFSSFIYLFFVKQRNNHPRRHGHVGVATPLRLLTILSYLSRGLSTSAAKL